MNFKLNRWLRNQKIKSSITSERNLSKLSYLKASVIAIAIGFVVGALIVIQQGYNGFEFIFASFGYSFDAATMSKTLNYLAVYIFLGLGLALGFKVGLFNMGGSGQAILGMTLAVALIATKANSDGVAFRDVDKSFVIVVMIAFILSGVFISTIAGLLKVFFNIHEVVTTVMLNWIVWYFSRWFLMDSSFGRGKWSISNGLTPKLPSDWLSIGGNTWILGVGLAVVAVITIYLLLSFTTFGFKFNVVGKQPQAAMYAGIKNRQYLILTTALQGLFIGLGSMFYWFNIKSSMEVGSEVLPSIGFDAIPIALVAFNNIIGVVPVALIWAMFKAGSERALGLQFIGLSPEISSLIFGIIIYSSAVYILFLKFKPIEKIKLFIFESKCYLYREFKIDINKKIKDLKLELKEINKKADILELKKQISNINQEILKLKIDKRSNKEDQEKYHDLKKQLLSLESVLKSEVENYLSIYKSKIKMQIQNKKMTFEEMYNDYNNKSFKGLKKKIKTELAVKYYTIMDQFVLMQIERNDLIKNLKLEKKLIKERSEISSLINKISLLKNNSENDKTELDVLKNELNLKIKNIKDEINNKIKEIINKYDQDAKLIIDEFNVFKKAKLDILKDSEVNAKLFLKENKEKYEIERKKLKDNTKDKEEYKFLELKICIEQYKAELEVVERYGK
ncbi:ABC transporter permease subunit [Spiroplasma monobiae]|uniref:Ribose/galactose ABC transporter permease n=1 Tax=Spiroplasma monobiae MQ-1 TaxID=1336748 RepID=A0A2K9LTC0_SPISQ|nr:hypothetical protein [Spiroplasma monobiae]AUM62338.1 ribose/galactose ABC transporter permease [Spiroplasma monobiae MQ-1]